MKKIIQVLGFALAIFALPAPAGNFVAGVFYTQAIVPSPMREITLVANAVVLPSGLGLPAGAGWVFETATNNAYRHDTDVAYTSVEVVVAYNDSAAPLILIYDWSCSTGSPCADGSTTPSYQWSKSVADAGSYLKTISRIGKNFTVLPYKNTTRKAFVNWEVRWQNEVFFQTCNSFNGFKFCTWKLVYSHLIEREAVIGMVSNALFGPVIETFLPNPVPVDWQVPTLGFFDSSLIVDGKCYPLTTSISEYRNPTLESNLDTVYLKPNISFLVQSPQ